MFGLWVGIEVLAVDVQRGLVVLDHFAQFDHIVRLIIFILGLFEMSQEIQEDIVELKLFILVLSQINQQHQEDIAIICSRNVHVPNSLAHVLCGITRSRLRLMEEMERKRRSYTSGDDLISLEVPGVE